MAQKKVAPSAPKKTYKQIPGLPFAVGENIFVRTVTHYQVGKVTGFGADFIVLTEVSWVADTGRFSEALKTGTLNEVECVSFLPWVVIGRGAIVDIFPWTHKLPEQTK